MQITLIMWEITINHRYWWIAIENYNKFIKIESFDDTSSVQMIVRYLEMNWFRKCWISKQNITETQRWTGFEKIFVFCLV